jgi:Flp pilus assembly protein TadD
MKTLRILDDLTRLREIMTNELSNRHNDPVLLHELGMLHLRNGQARQAVHWLEEVLKLDARHRPTHEALAQYYDQTGQPDRARLHRAKMQ